MGQCKKWGRCGEGGSGLCGAGGVGGMRERGRGRLLLLMRQAESLLTTFLRLREYLIHRAEWGHGHIYIYMDRPARTPAVSLGWDVLTSGLQGRR